RWKITVPAAGRYGLVIRYCAPEAASREVQVDDRPPVVQTFPPTGGFSSATDDWRYLLLHDGANPVPLELTAGEHVITMTNVDGKGLNLDLISLLPLE
ncbi:MAG: hypothetical protein H5T86_16605, partial [Armatimonadetes bacterium]|nr:hypothetical protein [Armatimonadota bacterium]